jgi:ABC-type transport system involved in multi-copper enzyme maturation permease subunit
MMANRMRSTVGSWLQLFRLCLKVTFSTRYWFLLVGGLVYFVILWLLNAFGDGDPYGPTDVLNGILAAPGVFLAILLGMQLVLQERETGTIEVMFAISRSRYRVWLLKSLTVYIAIFVLLLMLSVLTYITITDFPFLPVLLNSMVPALVFGNLTVLFSIVTRSTNGGALLAIIVLFLVVVFFPGGASDSIINPFLNFQKLARDLPYEEYIRIAVLNRLLVLGAAFGLLGLALRRTHARERLL